jgi:hypothetical protein
VLPILFSFRELLYSFFSSEEFMLIKISLTALALLILGFFYTTSTLSATANEITTNQGVTSSEASERIFLPSLKKELPTIQPTPSPTSTTYSTTYRADIYTLPTRRGIKSEFSNLCLANQSALRFTRIVFEDTQ